MTDLLQPTPLTRSEHWESNQISPNVIGRVLTRMWSDIADERRSGNRLARQVAEAASMRTQTVNLVVIAQGNADLKDYARLVTRLSDITPSRVVLLASQLGWQEALDVAIDVEERPNQPPHAPTRIEVISVRGRAERLASVATPLLVPELPDFVWCTMPNFAEDPVLEELSEQSDRVTVDSATSPDPAAALNYLVRLVKSGGPELHVSDMAWTRLTSWRQMVAQFFDHPMHLPCLYETDEVVIECARRDGSGKSGMTGALLAAAWLEYAMGWRAPGEELVRSRDGWKLTLRAGQKGQSREVVILIREVDDPASAGGLSSIKITSGLNSPGTFIVRRTGPDTITTISDTTSAGIAERTIYSANPDEASLLGTELRQFDADPVFEQSLQMAANMWPAGAPIA
jgi:glucose-6-phosphate dehydrogenase assembly protein OpcA